jgi:hypothetical protein
MPEQSYIGVGKVYILKEGASAGLVEVGNVDTLTLGVNEESKELRDFQSPGGGLLNEIKRIESVDATLNLRELKPENLAIALFGNASEVTGDSVAGEAHTAYQGSLVALAHPPSGNVVVTGSGGTPTYVEGTDYEVRPGGIFIVEGGGISDDTAIEVDYDYLTEEVIQALTESGDAYRVYFEGLNEAQSDKPVIVDLYRVRFGPAQQFDLIGDDFAGFQIAGKVLKDTGKSGAGVSQYFKVTKVQ